MEDRRSKPSVNNPWLFTAAMMSACIAIGGVMAAHYDGIKAAIKESNTYTDYKVRTLEDKINTLLINQENSIKTQEKTTIDIAIIKTLLSKNYNIR